MTIEVLAAMPPNQVTDPNIGATAPNHTVNGEVLGLQEAGGEVRTLTPIQEFYNGASVFITGGTGFMGKTLLEKLLRACPDIRCIYLLVRTKKGKNMHARVEDIFDDPVFGRLKTEQPKCRHKVQGVAGDCSLPGLGLSQEDVQMLQNEVTLVFHAAATVRFDEKLKLACAINVRATADIVELCSKMVKLKALVHVSTAYANCQLEHIDEEFYSPPVGGRKMISCADSLSDATLDKITQTLLDRWPNTYAFTKAIAEDIIKHEGVDLPVGMFRPAIVISSYKEPLEGWIDNMYGPTGVCAAVGTGIMRTMHGDPEAIANIVPVDMCINALIIAASDIAQRHSLATKHQRVKTDKDIPIYNYVSSVEKPIRWGQFLDLVSKHGLPHPSTKAMWYYSFTLNKNFYVHWLYVIFLHYIPALLADGVLLLVGKQPRVMSIYHKIHKFMLVISYFSCRIWTFTNNNTQNLWNTLSPEDQQLFFFNMKNLDWDEYFVQYMKGIRIYLIKDPIETLPAAKVRWNRLYVLHLTVKYGCAFLLLRLFWYIAQCVFNL